MSCEHRYSVEVIDGKGAIKCRRCGDIRADGLNTFSDHEAIKDRLEWQKRQRETGLILP